MSSVRAAFLTWGWTLPQRMVAVISRVSPLAFFDALSASGATERAARLETGRLRETPSHCAFATAGCEGVSSNPIDLRYFFIFASLVAEATCARQDREICSFSTLALEP